MITNDRSGVGQAQTLAERMSAERAERGPLGRIAKTDRVAAALRGFEDQEDKLVKLSEIVPLMQQLLLGMNRGALVRENAASIVSRSTDTGSDLLQAEGARFDMPTIFGGCPANSVRVVAVGGGSLQVNINGQGWLPVAAGDVYRDEVIWSLRVRVTTAAAGTAILRFGAYSGDPEQV